MIEFVGLDETIEEIKREASELPMSSMSLLSELSDIALNEVEGFKAPAGDYDFNDTVISSDLSSDKATIDISGSKVLMIEYGAGNSATSPSAYGFDGPSYGPGSYSMTEGTGEYAKYKSWHHHKTKYTSQPSCRYAYIACGKVMNNIVVKAKEAFK